MNREAYHRSIFLDDRISPASTETMRVPIRSLIGKVPPPSPTSWIFHVAHCGSTLLARALDLVSANLVLREPLALRQVALAPEPRLVALTAAMISKRYRPDLPTVVKANVPVNFLLPQLVGLAGDARAIFLHFGLRDYLLAILRDDGHRAWLRRVTARLSAYLGDLSALPDAERAATLWMAQIDAFSTAMMRLENARSLDAEAFFATPGPVLRLAAEHLGVTVTEQDIDAIVAGPLFRSYSKFPDMPFDNEMRLARRRELEQTLVAELEQAQTWVDERGGEWQALARLKAAALSPKNTVKR